MKKIILETDRFILEMINESYQKDLFELLSNVKVHKFFPGVLNEMESREFYKSVQQKYLVDRHCFRP